MRFLKGERRDVSVIWGMLTCSWVLHPYCVEMNVCIYQTHVELFSAGTEHPPSVP